MIDRMNTEQVLSQLLEAQASLRKKETTIRSKIEAESKEKEKSSLRLDFYKVGMVLALQTVRAKSLKLKSLLLMHAALLPETSNKHSP